MSVMEERFCSLILKDRRITVKIIKLRGISIISIDDKLLINWKLSSVSSTKPLNKCDHATSLKNISKGDETRTCQYDFKDKK